MNPDRQQAIEYLRAPGNGPWQWSEDGAVLVWRDGTTIAFRAEVVQIIEWLAPNGLPSFGAIVFLLAACRGKVPGVGDIFPSWSDSVADATHKGLSLTALKQLQAQVASDLDQLQKISKLPAELNSGIKAKCVLAEAAFELTKVERYVDAHSVLRGMREPMNDNDLADNEYAPGSANYIRQFHIVSEGLKPHTAESLALRLRIGLDALPKDVDAGLPAAERARRLIEELSRDREFGAVARAARELMAAVRLPRRLAEREQLAIGGVADITNRGPLDRLLLSELAHDDLTLSARVALNEALYLRREPPMREPPGALAVLLDSGVRLWGVPRALATAVALALIARDKQHSEILAWRAHGKELQPVDLLSRKGLTQHLGVLEPAAHAGESVPAFAEAASVNANSQSVLITHRDALVDPEFRRALAENPAAPGFVATVDRDGHFELHATPLAHRQPICEADLDLASVFDESVGVAPIKAEADPNLPAIFGVSPFPLLLPMAGKVDFWIKGIDGRTYAVLHDRRLIRYGQESGACVLASNLPAGKTLWMERLEVSAEIHVVKAGTTHYPARLLSLSLPYGSLRVTTLASGPEILAVHRYGHAILVIRSNDVRAYSLEDGRMLGKALNPHRWVNGRFFRGTSHFYFAVWDGERVKFEPVQLPTMTLFSSILTVFDRPGRPGPWVFVKSNHLVSLDSGVKIPMVFPSGGKFDLNFGEVRVSSDGDQLLVPGTGPNEKRALWLVFGTSEKTAKWDIMEPPFRLFNRPPAFPTWNIYRAIESVTLFQDSVELHCRNAVKRKLALDENGKLRLRDLPSTSTVSPRPIFSSLRKIIDNCVLGVAQLEGGSRIFLDSRGLLHFKSANPDLPEISIVLADGEVAGWTSDGCVCGPQFFFDGPIDSDPKGVFERILHFFAKL